MCKEILLLLLLLTVAVCYLTLNQSTWTSASIGKAKCAVRGYLAAGLAFFAIPFALAFTFSMGNWVTTVLRGEAPVKMADVAGGTL